MFDDFNVITITSVNVAFTTRVCPKACTTVVTCEVSLGVILIEILHKIIYLKFPDLSI